MEKTRFRKSTIRFFFWSDLNGSNFHGIVRYIFGKKFARTLKSDVKIVQWYEGQTYEKCLNRAIRESGKDVKIYGCQLFIFPAELLNVYIDKNEFKYHVPDVVLVNGDYFLDKNPIFKVGPALRYSRLYENDVHNITNQNHLVLLSYFTKSNQFVLNLIKQISAHHDKIDWAIKCHPSNNINSLDNFLKSLISFEIVDRNLYELFPNYGFVIGSASGSLVEAIAYGMPVILAAEKNSIEFNYLPEFCKGILWGVAYDVDSFLDVKKKLITAMQVNQKNRIDLIHRVRSELFNNPTETQILDSFELSRR